MGVGNLNSENEGIEEINNNQIKILVTDSGVEAKLVSSSDTIIESLPIEYIKALLDKKGIVYGVDDQVLQNISAHPNEYLNQEPIIAKGVLAEDGENASIEWIVLEQKQEKGPRILEDGTVDFYSVNKIINVTKGQLLAKKILRTDGKEGTSVYGKSIIPKKGKDIQFKLGKNVVVNETKDKVYAAIDGQLVITEQGKISVLPVYEVNGDLDFKVGNIDFLGTVIIKGNIPDGFKVYATGDIKVHGNVEGSELKAGGDIIIQQGVIGHNKSYIKSKKNIRASFILDGDLHASENIIVSQSIMHSNVSAGKQVVCNGAKGIIVGGKIQAGEKIIASIIGNELATITMLEVGINPEFRTEMTEIQNEKKEYLQSIDKIRKALQLFERILRTEGSLTSDKKKLQLQMMNQQLSIEKKLKELINREDELEQQFQQFDKTTIEVIKVVYPGVKIVIGKAVKFIKKEYKFIKFVLDEGEVKPKQI